jgi:hypothetical protein
LDMFPYRGLVGITKFVTAPYTYILSRYSQAFWASLAAVIMS